MSLKQISPKADYIQLNIAGLDSYQALEKYKNYNIDKPVLLHGDWTKKNISENNLRDRVSEYKRIIMTLKKYTNVIGITIHPPLKSKYSLDEVIELVRSIEKDTNVYALVENRSNHRLNVSKPEEVIKFSQFNKMTIDLPQLYISCKYDKDLLYKTLDQICWDNVYELHVSNIKDKRVSKKIYIGELNLIEILQLIKNKSNKDYFITLEILGSHKTFEEERNILITEGGEFSKGYFTK